MTFLGAARAGVVVGGASVAVRQAAVATRLLPCEGIHCGAAAQVVQSLPAHGQGLVLPARVHKVFQGKRLRLVQELLLKVGVCGAPCHEADQQGAQLLFCVITQGPLSPAPRHELFQGLL